MSPPAPDILVPIPTAAGSFQTTFLLTTPAQDLCLSGPDLTRQTLTATLLHLKNEGLVCHLQKGPAVFKAQEFPLEVAQAQQTHCWDCQSHTHIVGNTGH